MIKITVIYDNTVFRKDLEASWGFSSLVEAYGKKILFDTGAEGSILMSNMKKLRIDPSTIDEAFISHAHFDHAGGLSDFLEVNPVKVYIPPSCSSPPGAKEVVRVERPTKLHEHIYSTGELGGIEQSLIVDCEGGVLIIVGCSHPGVAQILKVASQFGTPYAIVGGLHGFKTFRLLRGLGLVCPTHCTQYKDKIWSLFPRKYVEAGAGRVIEV